MNTVTQPGTGQARAGRDPAPVIWVIALTCWAATVAVTVAGGMEAGAHDYIIEESPWSWPVKIGAFLAVWVVMLGAMMLPTTLPMARLFHAASARQPHPAPARAAFYAAYLALWGGFALLALVGDTRIHWLVHRWPWLADHEKLILASTVLLAGLYQLSALKGACLRACRSPMSMIGERYRRGAGGGWTVGVHHGLTCLGCCWALMLVMFATGVGSLLWMLALTAVMLVEKTASFGATLVRPVAAALIVAGVVVAAPAFW